MARDADARADIHDLKKRARKAERLGLRFDALLETLGYQIHAGIPEYGHGPTIFKLVPCPECGSKHEERILSEKERLQREYDAAMAEKPKELSWATLDKRLVLFVVRALQRAQITHGGPGLPEYVQKLEDFAEGRGEAPE